MRVRFGTKTPRYVVSRLISAILQILRALTPKGQGSLPSPNASEVVPAPPGANSVPSSRDGSPRADLYIPYLAGPEFRGRYREEVISLGKNVSLGALKNFIDTGCGPTEVSRVFNTKRRQLRARDAITRFEESLTIWRGVERFDSRVTWILPRPLRTRDLAPLLESIAEEFESLEGAPADWWGTVTGIDRWLPWLSLELVHKIRVMRPADLGFLRRVLIKATRDFGVATEVYPWTPGFPDGLAELPIHALYQFEPTYAGLRTLNDLNAVYCQNVGHLAAFDPLAWNAIHILPPGFWVQLARALIRCEL